MARRARKSMLFGPFWSWATCIVLASSLMAAGGRACRRTPESLFLRAGRALTRAAKPVCQARSFRNPSPGVLTSGRTAKWASASVAGGVVAGWCTAAASAGMPPEAQCEAESEDKKNHDRVALLEDIHVEHEWDPNRYGAYAFIIARIGKKVRYLAYSSDVGEAFRPVVPAAVVNASYGIAVGYCAFDVGYEGYKANKEGGDVTRAVVKQTVFQGLASIGLPFLIIHQSVHAAQKGFKAYAPKYLKWGPTLLGLAIIPFLPAVCDEPVEHALDAGFDTYWPIEGDSKKQH